MWFKDSYYRRTELHDWFISNNNFTTVSFKNSKISSVGMLEYLSRGNRLEYCAAHSDFNLGEHILSWIPKTL